MNKYEFVISAKDRTAQAFASINSGLGTVRKNAGSAALAISGTTAAFTALANTSIRNARDLDSMSKVAGYTVEEFQALSFAFENFNISQEKFADISKDVQDKLGDFIATGGGEFKDFFEQIAPQVGLTAESLKDLAGVDVLIAVKKAMDDANVSAKEQVFYMESIANDATLLLPALKDNGRAISDLAGEYKELNLAISQTEIDKIKELSIEVEKLESASSKFRDSLVANLAEPLADIVDGVHDFYNDAVLYLERDFIEIHKWTNQAALGFYEFQKAIGMDVDETHLQGIIAQTEYLSDEYSKLTKKINDEPIAYEVSGEASLEDIFEGTEYTIKPNIKVGDDKAKKEAKWFLDMASLLDEINGETIVLNTEIEPFQPNGDWLPQGLDLDLPVSGRFDFANTFQDSADEMWADLEESGLRNLTPTVDFGEVTAANQFLIDSTISTFEEIHEEKLRFADMDEELEQIRYERQVEQMEKELALLEEKGLATKEIRDRYNLAVEEAEANHLSRLEEISSDSNFWQSWLDAARDNLTDFDELSANTIENVSERFGDAFESMVLDSESFGEAMRGMAEGMTRSVINALGQMAAQWAAYHLVQLAVGSSTAAAGAAGMAATAQATALQAGLNAFASTAAIPVVGPPAAPAAMGAALAVTQPMAAAVGMLAASGATASFEGGGYTGDGPRSGGLDGKGGYLAMLHPQEWVTDFTKGQRLGGGQQQIVNNYYTTHHNNNISAMDAKSFDQWSRDKGPSMAKAIDRANRR